MRNGIVSTIILVLLSIVFGGTCLANDILTKDKDVMIVRNVPYQSDDPQQQTLDILMSGHFIEPSHGFKASEQPRPTVIYIHGGGWLAGGKMGDYSIFEPYIDAGWNIVSLNYRQGANTAPNAVLDVLSALKWLTANAERYNIDLQNIVMSGESAGGHLALIAAFLNTTPDKQYEDYYVGDKIQIRAVVNLFGISDIATLQGYLAKNPKSNYVNKWLGSRDVVAISKAYSPINYINANTPPVITFQGTKDSVVPFSQNENLHEKLKKFKIKEHLEPIKGRDHGDFSLEEWAEINKDIMLFLNDVMKKP